jgi:hypothetical protein
MQGPHVRGELVRKEGLMFVFVFAFVFVMLVVYLDEVQ